jgi:aryl-alcohol dehydrogenase-like predicted oxidoreductase
VEKILCSAQENKVGIIVRNPRGQGHLTNEFSDIMAETYAHNKKEHEEKKERAKQFQFLIKQNRTLVQAALHFVLNLYGFNRYSACNKP